MMLNKKMISLIVPMLLLLMIFSGCSVQTNNTATEETESVSIDVDIGFTVLKFPSKWTDSIRINKEFEDTIGIVEFFGTAGNHNEQLLFTLYFNQDGEIPIGTLVYEGQNIIICADMNELEFDEGWSQEEKDTLCAMQEDINYIVENLKENSDFTLN